MTPAGIGCHRLGKSDFFNCIEFSMPYSTRVNEDVLRTSLWGSFRELKMRDCKARLTRSVRSLAWRCLVNW